MIKVLNWEIYLIKSSIYKVVSIQEKDAIRHLGEKNVNQNPLPPDML